MTLWKHYHLANTVEDALEALCNAPGPVRLVSGGTDLLLDLEQGRHAPVETLVDVTQIPRLCDLEYRREQLFIGAAVPLNHIVASPIVEEHAQALIEACALIGGPQVRNTATLGGNVGHALPAADGTIALLALNAQVEIASPSGQRLQPIEELFIGPGKSTLEANRDIILGFYLPLREASQASAFTRVMRPQGVALPIINMAAWIYREGEVIGDVRLSVGPSGPTPRRGRSAEQALIGRAPGESALEAALDALLGESRFRTSPQRASADYRRHLVESLLRESVLTAWARTLDSESVRS
jgi:CO/xanthine dehydrogenase FAD-binding subunit